MHDFVRQGHLIFDLTFAISGPNKARAIGFFLFLRFFGLSKKNLNNVTFMHDLVRQGHLTFDLTFPISGPNKARSIVFLFLSFHGSTS